MSKFSLEFEIVGVTYKNTSKEQKVVAFVRNCLVKKSFEADLTIFCCYEYGTNASEVV